MASQTEGAAAHGVDAQAADAEHGLGKRRDFLTLLTGAAAIVGVGGFVWPFLDSLAPSGGADSADAAVDVDLSKIAPGQQIVVVWRGKPVFVVHRTPQALLGLQDTNLTNRLRDWTSKERQQPDYVVNWHRSIAPEYGVMVGICTHLGCVPGFVPNPSPTEPVANWPGGYACPCHGSKFDLAGRVFAGSPAFYNLPVPPYSMPTKTSLRIGASPDDLDFDFNSIRQL